MLSCWLALLCLRSCTTVLHGIRAVLFPCCSRLDSVALIVCGVNHPLEHIPTQRVGVPLEEGEGVRVKCSACGLRPYRQRLTASTAALIFEVPLVEDSASEDLLVLA